MKKLVLMAAFAGFLTASTAPAFSMISPEVAKTIKTGDDKEKKKKSKKGGCCSKEAKASCGPKETKSCIKPESKTEGTKETAK